MRPIKLHPQLSFEVTPHPRAVREGYEPFLVGSLKISGDFPVNQDLQSGDELTVQICTADGVVIANGVCEVKAPHFKDIKVDGDPIGMERAHVAKVMVSGLRDRT